MVPPASKRGLGLSNVGITDTAHATLAADEVLRALSRHANADWGEVGAEEWSANDVALREGERLYSVYRATDETRFWIITEADRASTTVLLPGDYG